MNTGAPVALGTANASSVAIADVDGDGVVDIVLGVGSGGPSQLYVNRGVAGGTWAGLRIPVAIGTTGATTALAIGDLDGDGDADLLLARNGTANLLFRGEPSKLTRVAFAALTGTLGGVTFSDGQGGFVLLGGVGGGLAGTFSGKVTAGTGFSVNASIAVRFNSSSRAVDETIDVGGVRVDVRFSDCEIANSVAPCAVRTGPVLRALRLCGHPPRRLRRDPPERLVHAGQRDDPHGLDLHRPGPRLSRRHGHDPQPERAWPLRHRRHLQALRVQQHGRGLHGSGPARDQRDR